ncbi:arsenate reductase (glutaredoxin) [Luteibacter pinisoli]|uniref:Arsenate reductase n=1 Tax=Luteibacter pinisoli TaxID=2589080 RepID=A0A4Y5Z166_9GAMM|nr:arsenate reductase (glutaredoxin) [Luteibacter pinisoli]QDE38951.1 arsenate reductase (glutaredoxin) [Luteibacter pinisoli]
MSAPTLWHNPRCSKSRETLALLQQHGIEPVIVEYLKAPPSAVELERVLGLLGLEPRALMRKGEDDYAGVPAQASHAELVNYMVEHPKLIERPVFLNGTRAAIGRPPEAVLAIL